MNRSVSLVENDTDHSIQIMDRLNRKDFKGLSPRADREHGLTRDVEFTLRNIGQGYHESNSQTTEYSLKRRYWIKSNRSVYKSVDPKQIVCVEALDHYCRFYVRNQSPIIASAKLKSEVYERDLSKLGTFFLLNRSTIINLDAVDQVDGNRVMIHNFKPLNKRELVVSKGRRKELFDALGIDFSSI